MNELIIVERNFDDPVAFADIQAREDAVAWCLEEHAVQFVRSYFAVDRRSMLCIYRAPDAEAVRVTQRQGGLPVARIWAATVLGDVAAPLPPPPPRVTIVVERDFPEPVTPELVTETLERTGGCLPLYRAELHVSHLSRDGRRMCCIFTAPDVETIRIANRRISMPVARAWAATVHDAPQQR